MNKTNKKRKVGQKKPRPQKPSPMLPILHRPGAEMSFSLYIIGWAFRSIVLFCGIFGLTLFIGCDVCVGAFNAAPGLLPDGLCRFAAVGMWLFYLPSQVLISLSALPEKEF